MAASDLATTAPATPSTLPAAVSPTFNTAAPGNATVASAAAASVDAAADFVTVLTQLLGATDTPAIALAETPTRIATSASDDKSATADVTDDAIAAAMLGAGVPWELLLASAAAAEHRQPAMSVLDSSNTAASSITAGATQAQSQAAQLSRDVQALLGQSALPGSETSQPPARESTANDGVALANAMSASAFNAQQLAPESEHSTVRAHVGAPAWADELGGKLTWMTERGIQSASLRLSPEHLGPLEIRISINHDQASVWFGAAHADTRTALEQALPRLREMFSAQGLNLADAGVFREPPREQAKNYPASNDGLRSGNERSIDIATLRARGIVDAYA